MYLLTPVDFCLITFSIALILFFVLSVRLKSFQSIVRGDYKYLVFLAVVLLFSTFHFGQQFFYGLEYEDAYVYNGFARLLLYNQNFRIDPFLTKGCLVGSLSNCLLLGTYSGHLIGFPSVVFLLFKLLGYHQHTICMVSFVSSLFSAVLVFLISKTLIEDKFFAFMSALVYSLTPIMSVFHTSSLSETFSSTFVLLALLVYLWNIKMGKGANTLDRAGLWVCLFTTQLSAVLIKRENLLLLSLPLITLSIKMFQGKEAPRGNLARLMPYAAGNLLIILFYLLFVDVQQVIKVENIEAGGSSFHAAFFLSLWPTFMRALFNIGWFSIFAYLFVLGICFLGLDLRRCSLLTYPLALFLAYLCIYSLHYRSYYFVKSGAISQFETLRYIGNCFPLGCFISGFALYRLNQLSMSLTKSRPTIYAFGKAIFLIFAVVFFGSNASGLRSQFFSIEQENRVLPVTMTLNSIDKSRSIIITDEPLLFQILGPKDLVLIELYRIGKSISRERIRELIGRLDVYYLKKPMHETAIQVERYPDSFRIINELTKKSDICISSSREAFQLILLR